jgi:hypothetical protein
MTGYSRKWRAANIERNRATSRRHYQLAKEKGLWLRARYALSPEQYDALLKAQGGGCAICGCLPEGNTRYAKLSVDHDHDTGQIRGLLCDLCNRGVGAFRDDPDRLRAAAANLDSCRAENRSPSCTNREQPVD